MSEIAIKVEGLYKQYKLGIVNTGTITHDINRWWHRVRGKEDPYQLVTGINDRTKTSSHEYVWALNNINFEVKVGEVLGIIGKNGAGKSTLLKVLSKVTGPTKGSIKVNGRIASLLEVGTGFHPELSGRENIFLNGAILGMTKKEISSKIDEIIGFSGVDKYIDTPVKRYSSGMYVRLAFAVAAHLEPEILIIDEVLAVGDAEFQKKCLGKMKDVANQGRTVLFVSHNMVAVQQLCSKGLFLKNGALELHGNIDKILPHYFDFGNAIGKNEVVDLAEKERSRGFAKVIKKAWLENPNGQLITATNMGEPFNICFEFSADFIIENALFGFGVENMQGLRITTLNNLISSNSAVREVKNGVAVCEFTNPNFMEGEYFISLAVVRNSNEWVDYIEQAFTFKVEPADIYNTGKLLGNGQGLVFMKGSVYVK
jgi:lipopolysaccharide transport system ATP-binding protein